MSILGATGSVGASTLDLIARAPDRFEVVALTANRSVNELAEAAIRHNAELAVIGDPACYLDLKARLAGTQTKVAAGPEALELAGAMAANCVVAAIVGAAGLGPTLAAVRAGRRVALANKECLVAAGELFMDAVRSGGGQLIPIDSEHSAVFQLIDGRDSAAIEKITLTASGGPFLSWTKERIAAATPEEAVRHPKWSMGPKISIDSATLMNKGLELIEAHHLFSAAPETLDVLVHPQSIVHCLVAFRDGSVLAQLACPDMRTPIAIGLSWPERIEAPTQRLDLASLGTLAFEAPDNDRFPALDVARWALARGGSAPAILNASNEIAVEAFIRREVGFLDIARIVQTSLEVAEARGLLCQPGSLDDVFIIDREGRELARSVIGSGVSTN